MQRQWPKTRCEALWAGAAGLAILLLGYVAPPYVAGIGGALVAVLAAVSCARVGRGLRAGVLGAVAAGIVLVGFGVARSYTLDSLIFGLLLYAGCGPLVGSSLDRLYLLNIKMQEDQRKLAGALTRLRQTEKELSAIVDFLPFGLFAVDSAGRVTRWNRALEEMTGVGREEILGRDVETCAQTFYGEARPLLVNLVLGPGREHAASFENFRQEGARLMAEEWVPGLYGGRGAYLWSVVAPIYEDGEVAGAVECLVDITERRRMEEELKYLSTHDTLTGLYNRAYFDEEVARLEKGRQFPISVILADVDGLKEVNDNLGHAAGDELLKRAAAVLKGQFRAEDVVARIGGDEFAVLLPGADALAVQNALARLRRGLLAHSAAYQDVPLSLSVGAATAERGVSLTAALAEADGRMYAEKFAKAAGGRTFRPAVPGEMGG